jgi:murein DD-endopeptidase MepM/ murein hydrolase activator NlpD
MRRRRKNLFQSDRRYRPKGRRKVALYLFLAAAMVLGLVSMAGPLLVEDPLHENVAGDPEDAPGSVPAVADGDLAAVVVPASIGRPVPEFIEATLQSGETASELLSEYLSPEEIHNLGAACREVFPLSRLRAGQPYRIHVQNGRLGSFEYEIGPEEKLVVVRGAEGFGVRREPIVYEVRTVPVSGAITQSLYAAVSAAGEDPGLAVRLAEIFAWDVDFFRDIQPGDTFKALVEKRYRKGQFAGYGRIMAAEFVNQGHAFRGYLFEDAGGRPAYFDAGGKSLRKAFLKAPLTFSRVSSGFSHSRLHPVLKIRRPHLGVDYAAAKGTPVKTIGDGTISARGWDRGGGNYLRVRHNGVYETVYMHLSGFAKGMQKGARVHQGQVIGYVGSTGLSTGPHLDFRMKKHGKYLDPRKVTSPPCDPVPGKRMAEFRTLVEQLTAELGRIGILTADAGDKPRNI